MKKSLYGILVATALSSYSAYSLATPVDVGLSLVIDVSGSVSTSEYNLQMDGYANAFRDSAIQSNILSGTNGAIGVNVVFFASNFFSTSLDTYSILNDTASINAFADTLDNFARPGGGGTAIYTGTNRAVDLMLAAVANDTIETTNLVIDVSGDGTSSSTLDQAARDNAAANNITINGLPIGSTSIADYYTNNVITSDGFAIQANSFADFSSAARTKLNIETGGDNNVPVPGTLALLGLGLTCLAFARKKRAL